MQKGSIKGIDEEVLQQFHHGSTKKSTVQRQQEEQQAKRKREEEEAARVLAECIAEFQEDNNEDGGRKRLPVMTFVKGDSIVPSSATAPTAKEEDERKTDTIKSTTTTKPGELYIMQREDLKPSLSKQTDHSVMTDYSPKRQRATVAERHRLSTHRRRYSPERKRHQSNIVTSNNNRNTAGNDNDEKRTRLFVVNLPSSVDELRLCEEFGRYGPLASVEIHGKRADGQKSVGADRIVGYVQFMRPAEAHVACERMDGKYFQGRELRVGWDRATNQSIVDTPIYVSSDYRGDIDPSIPRGIILNGSGKHLDGGVSNEDSDKKLKPFHEEFTEPLIPADDLWNWKPQSFSLAEGAMETTADDESSSSSDSDSDSDDEGDYGVGGGNRMLKSKPLTEISRRYLEQMLRRLTTEPHKIAAAMALSIDHTQSADEIVDLITASLMVAETPLLPTKLARLYLINDILHNTGAPVPNVKRYRTGFEQRMPLIFQGLGGRCFYQPPALSKDPDVEEFKTRVLELLAQWESRLVFTQAFIGKLRSFLLGKSVDESVSKQNEVATITGLSATAISDCERRKLREIERQVAEFARQLTVDSQSATNLDGRRRMTQQQINDKIMEYRKQLLISREI